MCRRCRWSWEGAESEGTGGFCPSQRFFYLTLPLLEALCLAGMGSLRPLYSIGEFSKVTGMSVKALRFYHEQGLLKPSFVDE